MKEIIDVLLIDDDPDICMMIEAILKFSGYVVKYSPFAERVPALLEANSPKVILMDLYLSGIDGRNVCKNIKSQQALESIKIIMMSAHPDARQICMEAGADDFIAKPFDIDHLVHLVQANLAA